MGKRIELPQLPAGKAEDQLKALYSYLYQMAEALNSNLADIGGNSFTDQEMIIVREVIGDDGTAQNGMAEAETLKSLIIKTAQFVKSEIDQYNMKLIGTYEAEGKLGRYVRKTQLDVDVTPTGIQQNYTFEEVIQGLKTYEVNAKNYIKTGLLRTVSSIPVYGVAIGKDVVEFLDDGTEVYKDENKVAELTADELSFWQGGNKIASYTGNRISFYYGQTEVFYIAAGKIYVANDMEIVSGKEMKIVSGGKFEIQSGASMIIHSENLDVDAGGLNVKSGTIRGQHFDIDGNELLGSGDIVISTEEPAAAPNRVWIKPLDSAVVTYKTSLPQRVKASEFGTKTLTAAGATSQSGTDIRYQLTIPFYANTSSGGNTTFQATISDGTHTATFSGTIPAGHYETGGAYVGEYNFSQTITGTDWMGGNNSLTVTISNVSGGYSETKYVNIGEIKLLAMSTGSGGDDWKNCEIKVYQGS